MYSVRGAMVVNENSPYKKGMPFLHVSKSKWVLITELLWTIIMFCNNFQNKFGTYFIIQITIDTRIVHSLCSPPKLPSRNHSWYNMSFRSTANIFIHFNQNPFFKFNAVLFRIILVLGPDNSQSRVPRTKSQFYQSKIIDMCLLAVNLASLTLFLTVDTRQSIWSDGFCHM